MVPGAGFPLQTINQMEVLQNANFGMRIQHILNDQSKRENFIKVNQSFRPHVVIFNNRHWEPGSFTEFQANRFHFLEGAVDPIKFAPSSYKKFPGPNEKKIIGGLANKNPMPLINAIRQLPDNYELRLFGIFGDLADTSAELINMEKLKLLGRLNDETLPTFYKEVDCVVHTESFAGWANIAAEALACGIPLICTQNGTLAFARDAETAHIISKITPEEIAKALTNIFQNHNMALKLSYEGRKTIAEYSWEKYSSELIRIMNFDLRVHYLYAPEYGFYGKWPLETRLNEV